MSTNNSNKPKLRFKGFSDDWEQRKAVDIADYSKGNGYSKSDLTENGTPIILYGRLYTKYQFAIDEVDTFATSKDGSIYSQGNEVIIPASGETAKDIARASAVEKSGILLGGDLNILRPFNFINPLFLALTISNGEPQKELAKKAQGKSVVHIHNSDIQEVTVSFPTRAEQDRIVAVFRSLDHLITLHQRKCDNLKIIKKSMLDDLFPKIGEKVPKWRFKGFNNDWEQRKWSDTVDISTEMVDPTSGEYDDMPHIAPGNIESFTGRILDNVKLVKEEELISGKFRFRPGDVVYGKINPQLGKYFYASVDGLTSADAYVFNGKNGVTQKFLFSLLQTEDFFKYSVSVSKRSGMPKINRDELNAYSFLAPKKEEQERIGDFLLDIDHLITLHQSEVERLKKAKQFFLDKMFI
ncbi:restriction endonuclease subunit S [Sharpea azabuensis]|uniref:Type I restriction enzyme, S subunit n=1 Tax=Sharpea azabuensis TaxID=322505 RepID=A0A1H6UEJ7_9FIRM|nr:restriction endonuclease subunit S [Sharpea azabuensis]SEI86252.1 type I restriction enzyme, S subunit [Sharpea azabuensis]